MVFSAHFHPFLARDWAGVRRISIALRHPSGRRAACWAVGLLAAAGLFWHLTSCAREGCQTLGGLSWLVGSLIVSGRAVNAFVAAYGWHLVAAIVSVFITGVLMMKRGPELGAISAGTLGSALALASMLCMATSRIGIAAGLAAGAGILIVVGGRTHTQVGAVGRIWPLLIPLGVGALLRFWSLAEYPVGFAQHAVVHLDGSLVFYEVVHSIVRSFDLSSVAQLWPLMGEQWGPMSMVDGVGFLVFGVGWVQARLTQAVLGCLAICVAYALGASLNGPRLGFLFSFLLAVSPWHISFSRYGDAEHVLPTLQVLLALCCVYRAARFGRTRDYVFAGVTVALSWYVYATNQIVPFLAAGYLIYKLIASRAFARRDGVKLIYMAAVFVVVSAPHLATLGGEGLWLARTPVEDFNPYAVGDLNTAQAIVDQLYTEVVESWFFRPGGGLGPAVQTLLIAGVVVCVAGLFVAGRRDSSVLLLMWLALSILPAVFAQTVQFRRLLLTLVVALALASVAILRTLDLLEKGGLPRRATNVILIGMCVLGTASNSFVYFEEVRVEECNLHLEHTEIAEYVSMHLGEAYLYVYAPTDTEKSTTEEYITLFAYQKARKLLREGIDIKDQVSVVEMGDLSSALRDLRSLNGKTYLVAPGEAMGDWEDPASLRSKMARHNRVVRRQGELVIWKWNKTNVERRRHSGVVETVRPEHQDSRGAGSPARGD